MSKAPVASRRPAAVHRPVRGFTLVELLMVLLLVAMASGLAGLALRDGEAARLEREGQRLSAMIEAARAQSRMSGLPVRFEFTDATTGGAEAARPAGFRFTGLPADSLPPGQWLDEGTRGRLLGAPRLVLGPEPLIGPQRLELRLGEQTLVLSTDGIGPFEPAATP